MKQRLQGVLAGVVIGTILTGGAVFAKQAQELIEVFYHDIKITVDGKQIETDTEPFTYNGRTYIPARAVAENMGGTVTWDENTNTVSINNDLKKEMKDVMWDGAYPATDCELLGKNIYSCISDLIQYRNDIVVGHPKNIDESHKQALEDLVYCEEKCNSFINAYSQNFAFVSETYLNKSAWETDNALQNYKYAFENIRTAYEYLDKYRSTEDTLNLQQYAIYKDRAYNTRDDGYRTFNQYKTDCFRYIYNK